MAGHLALGRDIPRPKMTADSLVRLDIFKLRPDASQRIAAARRERSRPFRRRSPLVLVPGLWLEAALPACGARRPCCLSRLCGLDLQFAHRSLGRCARYLAGGQAPPQDRCYSLRRYSATAAGLAPSALPCRGTGLFGRLSAASARPLARSRLPTLRSRCERVSRDGQQHHRPRAVTR
jgi:hypothetical protein